VSEAATFMRDNTTGNLVVSANCRKDGKIRYKMEGGHSYLMTEGDIETLSRYNFKPRFKALKEPNP
jgi:hypothetical protein